MSKKALRLFKEAFLRTLVIVLGVTIVFFAGFFIVKLATGGGNKNDQSKNTSTLDENALQEQLDAENATDENGTADQNTTEPATGDAVTTEAGADTTAATTTDSKSLKIAVLNSTGVKGLAAAWVEKLKAAGYTNVYAGNYKVGQLNASKIIAVKDGTGSDLVSNFKAATLETGSLTSGFNMQDSTISATDIDLFVIIGTDDDIVGTQTQQ